VQTEAGGNRLEEAHPEVERGRLQVLLGEFLEGSEQGRFVKQQIREVVGRSGSVKASAMVRRNQDDAKGVSESRRAD
jgi:hypothetical protein